MTFWLSLIRRDNFDDSPVFEHRVDTDLPVAAAVNTVQKVLADVGVQVIRELLGRRVAG